MFDHLLLSLGIHKYGTFGTIESWVTLSLSNADLVTHSRAQFDINWLGLKHNNNGLFFARGWTISPCNVDSGLMAQLSRTFWCGFTTICTSHRSVYISRFLLFHVDQKLTSTPHGVERDTLHKVQDITCWIQSKPISCSFQSWCSWSWVKFVALHVDFEPILLILSSSNSHLSPTKSVWLLSCLGTVSCKKTKELTSWSSWNRFVQENKRVSKQISYSFKYM